MQYFTIKENSFVAKLAARKLHNKNVAIVFGNCIYLHGVSKHEFLSHKAWLRHELKHIEQYRRLGYFRFIATYLWQTLKVGYYNCELECEARNAENDEKIMKRYTLKKT